MIEAAMIYIIYHYQEKMESKTGMTSMHGVL
jgi:hypothetical protein